MGAGAEPEFDPLERGEDLIEVGEYAAAASVLGEATRARPGDPRAFFALGWALENLDPPRYQEARAAYERTLELDPGTSTRGSVSRRSWRS